MHPNIATHIASDVCSVCGGPAPGWKCPKCGLTKNSFDPHHWRECRYGAKMQAECAGCKQAEQHCTCASTNIAH